MSDYSEDSLVEQPAIELFAELGWETANCFHEQMGAKGTLGRETRADVVLIPRLRAALRQLKPTLPPEAIEGAIEELTRDRGALSPAQANREVYRLLKDGVQVALRVGEDTETRETVRVIAWRDPQANDFLLASQFSVFGGTYTRRADLVGFVNDLPLVFVELKAVHKRLEDAYRNNLRDYRTAIPQLLAGGGARPGGGLRDDRRAHDPVQGDLDRPRPARAVDGGRRFSHTSRSRRCAHRRRLRRIEYGRAGAHPPTQA